MSYRPYLTPRYWPLWLSLGLLWLLCHLPFRWQLALGRGLGGTLYHLFPQRRRIALINLRLCLSELSETDREQLAKRHFESLGISLFEMGIAWWRSPEWLQRHCQISGIQHLQQAEAEERGVIILIAHFTTVEIAGHLGALSIPSHVSFSEPNNPLFNAFIHNRRQRYFKGLITHREVKAMIQTLKQGGKLWYSPDQVAKYSRGAIIAHYFGQPAVTTPATSRLAKISGAAVVPILPRRLADGSGYELVFQPALENFPSDDIEADTNRINQIFEAQIRQNPAQYLWVHKRFKTDLPDLPGPY